MKNFNQTFPHLAAGNTQSTKLMAQEIGSLVRFNVPKGRKERAEFLRKNGTSGLDIHRIVGVQKDCNGALCYRVVNTTFDDTFGRPMHLKDMVPVVSNLDA